MSTLAVLDPKQWYRSRGLALAAASTIIKLALEVCRIRSNRTLPALASLSLLLSVSPTHTGTCTPFTRRKHNAQPTRGSNSNNVILYSGRA